MAVSGNEALVKKSIEGGVSKEATPAPPVDVHTRAAEDRLKLLFGTRVRIVRRGQRGRIEIDFVNEDELQRLYERLTEE